MISIKKRKRNETAEEEFERACAACRKRSGWQKIQCRSCFNRNFMKRRIKRESDANERAKVKLLIARKKNMSNAQFMADEAREAHNFLSALQIPELSEDEEGFFIKPLVDRMRCLVDVQYKSLKMNLNQSLDKWHNAFVDYQNIGNKTIKENL